MRIPLWLAGALLAALLAGPQAVAQLTETQIGAIRRNCRGDYGTHCAGVPTGGQAALACLQRNMASLSPPCRDAVGAVGGAAASSPGGPPMGSPGGPAATPPPASRPAPHEVDAALRERCMEE